jgi:ribosomal-protein-alanine N-acetyltransferase
MSAVPKETTGFRPMSEQDLAGIIALERDIYPFPWTLGNFRDSLSAGYSCWVYARDSHLVGYAVMMVAVGEAHLLNLGIARAWQRKGLGRQFMQHLFQVAQDHRATSMFLEVRPSNVPAQRLYHSLGFRDIAMRKKYYPAEHGREDAIMMARHL